MINFNWYKLCCMQAFNKPMWNIGIKDLGYGLIKICDRILENQPFWRI